MVPFERFLSEKHKIFDFLSTEFKLWQLTDSPTLPAHYGTLQSHYRHTDGTIERSLSKLSEIAHGPTPKNDKLGPQ